MMQRIENTDIINWESAEVLKTIKDIYGKKLTNEEFSVFVNLGRSTGLNPFLKEMWAIKYGDSAASIFVGRDGYRKSAQANSNYDYHLSDAVYSNDSFSVHNGEVSHEYRVTERGNLAGAYCIVKRKSSSKPIFVYVELKEYDTNKSLWATKKATMIKKVAEAQCLRMAFQELFGGTYSEDEFVPENKEDRNTNAQLRVSNLIEGKAKKIHTMNEIILCIEDAQEINDLLSIPAMTSNLSEDEKIVVRLNYKAKELLLRKDITGEVPAPLSETDKIRNQLLNAKSSETLDIAADLISSLPESDQEELTKIYFERKSTFNDK
jgi:phage recombination protein Bet